MKNVTDSAGGSKLVPGHQWRDWGGLRAEYESTGRRCSLRYLAEREGIPISTMFTRSKRECWIKHQQIAKQAVRNVANKAQLAIVEDKLAPWIEHEKAKFIKQTYHVAKRGVSRVAKHQKANPQPDARDEANMAKALESLTRVGRLSLGLSDGTAPTGTLNFQMLSNKTAIQITTPGSVE